MSHLKTTWIILKQQWLPIVVLVLAMQAAYQMYDQAVLEPQRVAEQKKLDDSRLQKSDDKTLEALNQSNELVICALAFHIGPDEIKKFLPNLDVERCKLILVSAYNGDGSFFSNDIQQQIIYPSPVPSRGQTGAQGPPGPQGQSGDTGIVNDVGGFIGDTLNRLGF